MMRGGQPYTYVYQPTMCMCVLLVLAVCCAAVCCCVCFVCVTFVRAVREFCF